MIKKGILLLLLIISANLFAKEFIESYSYPTLMGESKMRAKDIAYKKLKDYFSLKLVSYVYRLNRRKNPDAVMKLTDEQRNYVTVAIDSMLVVDESWDGAVYKVRAKVYIDENKLFPPEEKEELPDSLKNKSSQEILAELRKWGEISQKTSSELSEINLHNKYVSADKKMAASKSFGKAQLYMNVGNYRTASKFFKKTLDSDPFYKNAKYNLGLCYLHIGAFLDAVKTFKQVILSDKDNEKAYYNLGVSYSKMGNWQKAIDNFKKTLDLKKDYREALYALGNSYIKNEESANAIPYLQQATELDSTDYKSFFNIGYAYDDIGKYDQAIASYKKTIELKSDFSDAYTNMGFAYFHKEDFDKALNVLKKAIEINPNDDTAFLNIGKVYNEMKEKDKSLDAYQKAARLGNVEAKRYLNKEHYSW